MLFRSGFDVIVLDRNPKPRQGARFVTCDIFTDWQILKEEIHTDDTVIHLASTSVPGPGTGEDQRVEDARDNIGGTISLLEICAAKRIRKFIFPSSGGTVYGNRGTRFHVEEETLAPQSSYGAVKAATENYLGVFEHLYGLRHTILRISNPYGRKTMANKKLGAIDVFMRQAQERQRITVWGDGYQVRDYIYIEDVIDFFLLAIERAEVTGVYNVGTGVGANLREILSVISKVIGKDIDVVYGPGRVVDVKHNVLDISKAHCVGWRPKYALREGILLTYVGIES